jgi:hypothetical protein
MDDVIKCPYCGAENDALDYEDCDIDFTTMNCEECKKSFCMSRKIILEYSTWENDGTEEME